MAMALVLALIVTGTPLASAARTAAVVQKPMRDLTFDYFTDVDNNKPKKTAEIEGTTYLCCCRQEDEEVECRLSDMTATANMVGIPGKCKTHLGKGWTSWYNVGKSRGPWGLFGRRGQNKEKLEDEDGPVQACKIPEEDVPKPTTTTTTTITTTTITTTTTTLWSPSGPVRDLTRDYFTDVASGKPKKIAEIEGVSYLCCCRQHKEHVECKLDDMTESLGRNTCGTHVGEGWTSWYNVGKPPSKSSEMEDQLTEGDYLYESCKVVETELPDAIRTTTTTTTTSTTTTITTTTTTTTTVTTTTSSTTTTTTERMRIIDMSLNGDADDAFTVIGYKTYKCCCASDTPTDAKASKEIQCELFNVEEGSEDLATGYFTETTTGCKQMAAFVTTPLGPVFPWLTLVHKLVILFHVWECLGLGVLHGPLHGKMSPPFTDWWYRWTPGTIKYNAPFMTFLPNTRNILDVIVEGVLTYFFAARCLLSPEVTPDLVIPLALCCIYEFFFDYGQHMSNYGTQNLHFFVCMCFPVAQGQLVGIQLFLSWFYFCSGFCKIGPTFKYFFNSNIMCSKFMVGQPWSDWFRKTFVKDHANGNYQLTNAAYYLATLAAAVEMIVPLFTWSSNPLLVYFSIFTFLGMHAFIISTLIIDVFVWNFVDATWYVILYGVVSTGVDWGSLSGMHPLLAVWLLAHLCYSASGHFYPNTMPYVVCHRHAAGNWSQGVLVVKKSAAAKLGNLKAHGGLPSQGPGWAGEWFGFQAVWAYFWGANVPTKMLPPLVEDVMGKGAPSDGMFHSTGDYILIHSVLFYDALIANVRFDGISSLPLTMEVGRVCGFEEGECTLCWAGPFPTFAFGGDVRADWKIVDSKVGVKKEGTYTMAMLEDPAYTKPSACGVISLEDKKKN